MANVSLKTDFKDGEKLFGQQLNNNFVVIKAALEAMNKIVWQDDPDDSVSAFRGTTEEINQRDIIDGQLLYDTTTGETYIDVGSQRISTGSGNAIHIGSDTPTNPSTQIWIDPNEPLQLIGTEVTNSMEGTESNKAPSVQAIKNYIANIYSTDEVKTNEVWINNKPIYRKAFYFTQWSGLGVDTGLETIDNIINASVMLKNTASGQWMKLACNPDGSYGFYIKKTGNTYKIFISNENVYTADAVCSFIEYTKTTD